jgi:hypothetical protein
MSCILYYSNFCKNCEKLIAFISKTPIKDDMHFICLDKRTKKSNGATYIILQNGQELLLPPTVTQVPALLLLNRGHQVLFGEDIMRFIQPQLQKQQQQAFDNNGEPSAFLIQNACSNYGVASDQYSYLDQDADELFAKGNGGMRQTHHYASIHSTDMIETPPDTYQPDRIKGEMPTSYSSKI